MRTPEEVAELLAAWNQDPYWALESTPGFEDHWRELRAHRIGFHARKEADRPQPAPAVPSCSAASWDEVVAEREAVFSVGTA